MSVRHPDTQTLIDHWDEFAALYPTTPNAALAERFGVSERRVPVFASERGLHKDAAYISVLHSRQNQGRHHTPESLAKIREANKRLGERQRGSNHPRWNGGTSDMKSRFRDPRYKEWHLAVLARDNYTCQHCHQQFKPRTRHLAAHHIKGYTAYPDLRYDLSNGICLCGECHSRVHGKRFRPTPLPLCECGCGEQVQGYRGDGSPNRFLFGHSARGHTASAQARENMRKGHLGKKYSTAHSEAQKARRAREKAEGLRSSRAGVALSPDHRAAIAAGKTGQKPSPEHLAACTEGQRKRRERERAGKTDRQDTV